MEPVVEGVLKERPEWAINTCKVQVDPIIENDIHDSYRTVVRWLERAGSTVQPVGQLDNDNCC